MHFLCISLTSYSLNKLFVALVKPVHVSLAGPRRSARGLLPLLLPGLRLWVMAHGSQEASGAGEQAARPLQRFSLRAFGGQELRLRLHVVPRNPSRCLSKIHFNEAGALGAHLLATRKRQRGLSGASRRGGIQLSRLPWRL